MELFQINKTKSFLKLFEQINNIFTEIVIRIEKNGFFIQSMDNSCVILADLKINRNFFHSYSYDDQKTLELGIHVKSFFKILKILNLEDNWIFIYNENELEIITKDKEFTLNLMNIDCNLMTVEDIDYPVIISLKANYIKRLIKDLGINEIEDISFIFKKENITLSSKSDHIKCNIKLDITFLKQDETDEKYDILYNYNFLDKLIQSGDSVINMYFDQNAPLRIEYKVEDYDLSFYLAPKIKDDD